MKNKLVLVTSLVLASAAPVFAELPAGIATELGNAETDAIAAIGLGGAMILAIGVIGVAWRVAAKYLRRASGAA
jgi:hypothetical protein